MAMNDMQNPRSILAFDASSAIVDTPMTIERADQAFFARYDWALNPFICVAEARRRLADEIDRLSELPADWRRGEVAANVYLLASAALHGLEEYLRGKALRLPGKIGSSPFVRLAARSIDLASNNPLARRRNEALAFHGRWSDALHEFLCALARESVGQEVEFAETCAPLRRLAVAPLAEAVEKAALVAPSPFRRLDLSHHDVVALGRRLAATCASPTERLVLVGLRTSGSYFAPLIRATLACEGVRDVRVVTFEPKKGPGRWERKALIDCATRGYRAVIVDDSPHSGGTIFSAWSALEKLGFARERCVALVPVHPAKRGWRSPLPDRRFIELAPEDWFKAQRLVRGPDPDLVARAFALAPSHALTITPCGGEAGFSAALAGDFVDPRAKRLKQIYRVAFLAADGRPHTRYVLGKSVGWGWLGYHSEIIGERLAGMTPPVVGLRDGILYTEFFPQGAEAVAARPSRAALLETVADYVGARTRRLRLETFHSHAADPQRHNSGLRLVEKAVARTFGRLPIDMLMRPRLAPALRQLMESAPTLIDGAMQPSEWVFHDGRALKSDNEHHGLGKGPVNVVEPAFDLADAILHFALSSEEEARLIERYRAVSDDQGVGGRMLLSKLAAGLWSMNEAQDSVLAGSSDPDHWERANRRYLAAWDFLTREFALFCGGLHGPLPAPQWRSPIVALDIDGVIDRRLMGFPATSLAGAQALALLAANRICAIVDTARSCVEARDYCRAYGLAGGVAEHGGYIWDAVSGRGRSLVSEDASAEMEILRARLRAIPGVFLDERHRHSVRAFTYKKPASGLASKILAELRTAEVGDGALAPLPPSLANAVMAELKIDKLAMHHTSIDTTFTARGVDKGVGLNALRDWTLGPDAATAAVGDGEPDLAMFAVAGRAYAPANLGPKAKARLLNCRVANDAFQRGLLEIAEWIVAEHAAKPIVRPELRGDLSAEATFMVGALQASDRGLAGRFARAIFDRHVLEPFIG